ncbi:MAG: hypothetical protein GY769_11510 [bacterium]|nr:hypothetical protein [bacterium]
MTRLFLVVGGLVLFPAAGRADRILLENGKSFDDVVLVSQTQAQVRFRVASGEMSLPSSWVMRVERAPGALAEYLARAQSLAADPEAPAQAWLGLARWARARDLDHGFREALLMAGELEPKLEELLPLMARIGYRLDPETHVWLHGGPARPTGGREPTDRARPASEEAGFRTRSEEQIAEGLTRALETLAEAELERTRGRSAPREPEFRSPPRARTAFYPLVSVPVAYAATGWVFPGVPLRPSDSDPGDPIIRRPANPQARALLSRPPGSLLPVSAYRH